MPNLAGVYDGNQAGSYDYGGGSLVIEPLVSEVVYPTLTLEGSLSIPLIECDIVFDTITLPDTVVIPPIYVDAIYPAISLNGERIYYSNNLVVF